LETQVSVTSRSINGRASSCAKSIAIGRRTMPWTFSVQPFASTAGTNSAVSTR
jgi:hypothetical protein